MLAQHHKTEQRQRCTTLQECASPHLLALPQQQRGSCSPSRAVGNMDQMDHLVLLLQLYTSIKLGSRIVYLALFAENGCSQHFADVLRTISVSKHSFEFCFKHCFEFSKIFALCHNTTFVFLFLLHANHSVHPSMEDFSSKYPSVSDIYMSVIQESYNGNSSSFVMGTYRHLL